MANIFDVANYILRTVGAMSTLKLQKLTYYCQAWSLAWTKTPLFVEDFEAWSNGPVNPKLFKYFQGEYIVEQVGSNKLSKKLTTEDIKKINTVIESYGDFSGAELSSMTHAEQPWVSARGGLPNGVPCSSIITKESMLSYYSSLINRK